MSNVLRRTRGYAFEYMLVLALNKHGWIGRRLGGTSTGLPDIVATHEKSDTLISLEAKSTVGNHVYVPHDQILRCGDILKMFSKYDNKHVVFAFKFSGKTKARPLRYYFLVCNLLGSLSDIESIGCNYKGDIKINTIENKKPSDILWYDTYYDIERLKSGVTLKSSVTNEMWFGARTV
jgi:Holliday junction resolvase